MVNDWERWTPRKFHAKRDQRSETFAKSLKNHFSFEYDHERGNFLKRIVEKVHANTSKTNESLN